MGVERMACCGALTSVYGDAGHRKHRESCQYYTGPRTKWLVKSKLFSDGRVWGVYSPEKTWPFVAWFTNQPDAFAYALEEVKGWRRRVASKEATE